MHCWEVQFTDFNNSLLSFEKNGMSDIITILVVEDEQFIREAICEILTFNGYETKAESNGINGLRTAIITKPDLILCDVMMPKFSGLQMLKALRKNSEIENTPFIFLSALASMEDLRRGMNLGADDYLVKPFDRNELLDIISLKLSKSRKVKKHQEKQFKETVNKLENKVEKKTKNFRHSLDRAKNIQNVILPSKEKMVELLPQHFNFYKPKDVISGDFYLVRKIKDHTMIAVADCTGHGVPGALISIACYTSICRAIDQFGLNNSAKILTETNKILVNFMNQNQRSSLHDGMDIALCIIDHKSNLIRFAGAKRPLYMISKDNSFKYENVTNDRLRTIANDKGGVLYEIRGGIYSIGTPEYDFNVQEQIFKYQKGDIIYLSSDGYVDQFGGELNRKYSSKKLKELLLSTYNEKTEKQGQLLESAFESWKGNEEQTDDVTLMGIRL